MKIAILVLPALLFVHAALAKDTHVRGYVKKDGTYVQPHYRSHADGNPYNNYSTKGNINPYTGKAGTVDPNGHGSNSDSSSDNDSSGD